MNPTIQLTTEQKLDIRDLQVKIQQKDLLAADLSRQFTEAKEQSRTLTNALFNKINEVVKASGEDLSKSKFNLETLEFETPNADE